MKRILYQHNWPDLWKEVFQYDQLEFFTKEGNRGYTLSYENRFNAIITEVKKCLPKGSKILDVAAAQGNFTLTLAEFGYDVTWNDLRENLIQYVKLKYETGKISFAPGNAFDLHFETLFDGVIITEIIEHVAHPDLFLNQVARLLKPGGYIFMSTPLGSYFLNKLPKFSECKNPEIYENVQFKPNSDGHIFLLYENEIKDFAKKSGLKICKIKVINNSLTSGHLKLRYLLKILNYRIINTIEKLSRKLPHIIRNVLHSNIIIVLQNKN